MEAMKHRRKSDLPEKICTVCGRPFAWRRKWRKDWEEVKYCSDACRRRRGPNGDSKGPIIARE
jgi:hypothetical protein